MLNYYKRSFSTQDVNQMINNGTAIRADYGGLILGRSHDEGGIFFLVSNGADYLLEGEAEGYEYILNLGATFDCKGIFDTLNNYSAHRLDHFYEYEPPLHILTLDARSAIDAKYLIFEQGGFGIINKFSSEGYLNSLDQLNRNIIFETLENGSCKVFYTSRQPVNLFFYSTYEGQIIFKTNTVIEPVDETQKTKKRFWKRIFGG